MYILFNNVYLIMYNLLNNQEYTFIRVNFFKSFKKRKIISNQVLYFFLF